MAKKKVGMHPYVQVIAQSVPSVRRACADADKVIEEVSAQLLSVLKYLRVEFWRADNPVDVFARERQTKVGVVEGQVLGFGQKMWSVAGGGVYDERGLLVQRARIHTVRGYTLDARQEQVVIDDNEVVVYGRPMRAVLAGPLLKRQIANRLEVFLRDLEEYVDNSQFTS